MRNPNRTTKPERRAARRLAPTICRTLGIGATARLRRQGLSDDATGFDRMFLALDLPPGLMGDGTGSQWSHAQNYAKTEDGRVVYIDPVAYARGAQDLMDELTPHLNTMLHAELTTVTGLDGTNYTVSYEMPEPVTEVRADYRALFVEEYRGLYGDRVDLAAAPVGAPPFNIELFETYRRGFESDGAQFTAVDADGNPAIVYTVPSTWACIVCGGPSEPNSTVCSAGCGYELTGEYPDLYEKDYGPEDVNPDA